jgi:hypothetical protein
MLGSRKVGGMRLVGTGYVKCKECGVELKPGAKHPLFDVTEMINGIPVNRACSHVGKVVSDCVIKCDDWNDYVRVWR